MHRSFIFFILILFSACFCYAGKALPAVKQKVVLKTDSSIVNIRSFNDSAIKAYSKQKEFHYRDVMDTPSYWTRFWRWFWHLFNLGKSPKQRSSFFYYLLKFIEYTLFVAGAGAIVFFILKLAGVDTLNIFRRKPVIADLPYTALTEDIHQINFDGEIEKAINTNNYRLAVRLLYLKCLKHLSDAALINWQPEKTNTSYVNELSDYDLRHIFILLTRRFEYIWYGDFIIDANVFKEINSLFQQFNRRLG